MRGSALALAMLMAGCGRFGFDAVENDRPDSDPGADAAQFICPTTPAPSSIDVAGAGDWVQGITGASLAGGDSFVGYVAPDGVVFGATYAMTDPIVQEVSDTTSLSNGPAVAMAAIGSGARVLVAWRDDAAAQLLRLDQSLQPTDTPLAFDYTPLDVPFARSGDATVLALAYNSCGCGAVSASQIDIDGDITGTTSVIIDAAENAIGGTLVTADEGFVSTWVNDTSGVVRIERLDPDFAVIAGPVDIDVATTDTPRSVRAVWLPGTAAHLVAWELAGVIRMAMLDDALGMTVTPRVLGEAGTDPRVATDGMSFWAAWKDPSTPTHLALARIAADGTVTAVPVVGTGGTVVAYDLISLAGRVWLVWVERGGTGGNLQMVPACVAG